MGGANSMLSQRAAVNRASHHWPILGGQRALLIDLLYRALGFGSPLALIWALQQQLLSGV